MHIFPGIRLVRTLLLLACISGSLSALNRDIRPWINIGSHANALLDSGAQLSGVLPPHEAQVVSGGGTFDINAFLGADRYYQHTLPINGQNTVATNLEAGHIWNGHETLAHVTHFTQSADTFGDGNVNDLYDRHATWAGMILGGRPTETFPSNQQIGLAPGTDLRSAAIATQWNGNAYALNFSISVNSLVTAYNQAFAQSDVINNSYGYTDSAAAQGITLVYDGLAWETSQTVQVASAGNSGPAANTVGAPGVAYNVISVAALGDPNTYDSVAGFSSRSPSDFLNYNSEGQSVIVAGVRAAVTLAAPGSSLTSAFYGGQSGGNNPGLSGSTDMGSIPGAYSNAINGTSFSAPIVAGGVALMISAAKSLPELAGNDSARESVVIRSILMTSADKTSGWDNGQEWITDEGHSYISTTRSLDWAVGAGRMNLDRAFDIQVTGQTGVADFSPGDIALVDSHGWNYGWITLGLDNTYILADELLAGSTLTASLSWLRVRLFDAEELMVSDVAQADLQLSVWTLDEHDTLLNLIAQSVSEFNNDEHLHIVLPETGSYGLRVSYPGNIFDNTLDNIWGSEDFPQDYGLSWYTSIIPEPATYTMLLACLVFFAAETARRRRQMLRRQSGEPS